MYRWINQDTYNSNLSKFQISKELVKTYFHCLPTKITCNVHVNILLYNTFVAFIDFSV